MRRVGEMPSTYLLKGVQDAAEEDEQHRTDCWELTSTVSTSQHNLLHGRTKTVRLRYLSTDSHLMQKQVAEDA